MFPNSSNSGHQPFPSKRQQQSSCINKFPLNIPPVLLSHHQSIHTQFNFQNATVLFSGNFGTVPAVPLQPTIYENSNPVPMSNTTTLFRGKKRLREPKDPYDAKRQRFPVCHPETTIVNQAEPLPEERRYTFPRSVQSALRHRDQEPDLTGLVPALQNTLFPDPLETTAPVAKDKLSQQILDLFQACQQQTSDLNRKELCRTELQREIQRIFPESRLFLVGSSLNGFATRTSDGDLCLVVKEEPVNQKTEARRILGLIQKLFITKLSSYIERPQLIRAKVPIVKFRDKVSHVEFDLNVNNVVGIRNTFLLRTYAYNESRVRPLVVVIKKWASFHEINDASRGTLNSYSLVLMVLHYLQILLYSCDATESCLYPSHRISNGAFVDVTGEEKTLPEPILPSLQKNYPECFDPAVQLHLIHRVPCNIPPFVSKNESSLGDLLIGFFKYYATEFDWSRQMISVREAKAIPRPDGTEWRNKFICVEEPFDGTNTARAVHEKQKFDKIRSEILEAWRILQDKKDLNYVLPLRAVTQKR